MMENDNSFLPYFITEDIYVVSEEAVDTAEQPSMVAESIPEYKPTPIKYKGTNRKGILILIENSEGEYLNSDDELFLTKILQAVSIQFEDIALVNITAVENFDQILAINHQTAIAFTSKYARLNTEITTELYQIQTQETTQILLAHPLHEISQEKEKKMKLWKQLQVLF